MRKIWVNVFPLFSVSLAWVKHSAYIWARGIAICDTNITRYLLLSYLDESRVEEISAWDEAFILISRPFRRRIYLSSWRCICFAEAKAHFYVERKEKDITISIILPRHFNSHDNYPRIVVIIQYANYCVFSSIHSLKLMQH